MLRLIQIAFVCLFISCQDQNRTIVFAQLEPWTYIDKLTGSIDIDDPSDFIEVEVTVNYNESFPYENLYIKYLLKAENEPLLEEVKSLQLQNELGQWTGKKNNSGYSQKFILIDSLSSSSPIIDFEIFQYSRIENLSGINSLSIRIANM